MKSRIGLFLTLLVTIAVLAFPLCLWSVQQTVPDPTPPAAVIPLEAKIIIVAGIAFSLLQGIKQLLPGLSGWPSLILNVVLSAVGVAVAAPPGTLFSIGTVLAVVQAVAMAAGAHGTWKLLISKPSGA